MEDTSPQTRSTSAPAGRGAAAVLKELGPRLALPGAALALVSLGAVAYLDSLYETPFRLPIFLYLFRTHESAVAILYGGVLLAVVLVARFVPASGCERLVERLDERPAIFLTLIFGALATSSLLVYRGHALSMDEYAMLYQAKIFAAGRLTTELPPALLPWLFPGSFVDVFFAVSPRGEVASRYLPGFSLLLTPFAALDVPWLLNPLLAVALLLLFRAVARRLLPGTSAGGWALILAAASPELTMNGISFFSMNAHLAANLLFVLLVLHPGMASAFAAGVVGSLGLTLHQPVPHAAFALPWIAWLAVGGWNDRSGERGGAGLRRVASLAAGYLPLLVLLLGGWWVALLGSLEPDGQGGGVLNEPLARASILALPAASVLGARGLELLRLFLWATPGLPMLALLGLRGRWRTPWALLALSLVLTFAVLLFIPFDQGHGWGTRYLHPAWGALPLLGAAFLATAGRRRPGWTGAASLLVAVGLLVATPVRFHQAHAFIGRHLSQLPPLPPDLEGSVVFLNVQRGFHSADLVQNDPFLRDPHWILVSHGRETDEAFVRALFPGARLLLDNGVDSAWSVRRANDSR